MSCRAGARGWKTENDFAVRFSWLGAAPVLVAGWLVGASVWLVVVATVGVHAMQLAGAGGHGVAGTCVCECAIE